MPGLSLYLHPPAYRAVHALKAHAHNIYALHIPARFYYARADVFYRLHPGKGEFLLSLAQSIIHAYPRHILNALGILKHGFPFCYNLIYDPQICYSGFYSIYLHTVIARLKKHSLFPFGKAVLPPHMGVIPHRRLLYHGSRRPLSRRPFIFHKAVFIFDRRRRPG